jgi:hypothetical protein
MKIKQLFSFSLCFFIISCSKSEDDPASVVLKYVHAINASDSIGMISCLNSIERAHYYSLPDTARSLEFFKGMKIEAKVISVERESENRAQVLVSEHCNIKGKNSTDTNFHSYAVFKEQDGWKLTRAFW